MKNISVVYIVLLILLITILGNYSFCKTQKIEVNQDSVSIVCSLTSPDRIKIGNLIYVEYQIINNSNFDIFILDPDHYCKNPDTIVTKIFKRELGGSWEYRLGYMNSFILRKIPSNSNFTFKLKYLFSRNWEKDLNYENFIINYFGYSNILMIIIHSGIFIDSENKISKFKPIEIINEKVVDYEIHGMENVLYLVDALKRNDFIFKVDINEKSLK